MNQLKTLFIVVHQRTLLTRGPQTSPLPHSLTKRRALGSRRLWKDFISIFYIFYRFLTSSYRQTAIQAFGGHQNVYFHSVVRSIADVEAGLVGCSSVFIRLHSREDISNSSWCRCTKHHAGSRIAAFLSRIFFHYPGLLIRSRVTVLNIGLFLAGGRRAKRSKNRHEEFSPARTERCMGLIPRALPAFSKRYIVPLVWFPHMIWGCHS